MVALFPLSEVVPQLLRPLSLFFLADMEVCAVAESACFAIRMERSVTRVCAWKRSTKGPAMRRKQVLIVGKVKF